MVMETPGPQCVGREFVRQYYTMLHEAPLHLHRFYSQNSSFVHGGVEKPGEEMPPVMGQAEIHKKIMSLNFRDCHAKIRQVDSQSTVGSAVVVQVTGELSNNGLPMRRFMQTFVLAPQSPKKYYVHNDIFRYQDEVFHDNDTDTETQEEPVDIHESEPEVSMETPAQTESVQDPTVTSFFEPVPPVAAQQPLSNGDAHMADQSESPVPKVEDEPEAPAANKAPESTWNEDDTEEEIPPEPEVEPQPQAPTEPPKPATWAAMLTKNSGQSEAVSAPAQPVQQVTSTFGRPGSGVKSEQGKQEGGGPPQPQRAPRPPRGDRGPPRERDGSRQGGDSEDSGRRLARFPDSQQVFVGNLPQHISENDIRTFFGKYGKVVECRINQKKGGEKVPNFGFVVFDSKDPVQKILMEKKPIMLKDDLGEHRLNVEEKKQKLDGGRPGSGTRIGGRGGGQMGPGRGGYGIPGRGGGRGGGPGGGRGGGGLDRGRGGFRGGAPRQ